MIQQDILIAYGVMLTPLGVMDVEVRKGDLIISGWEMIYDF